MKRLHNIFRLLAIIAATTCGSHYASAQTTPTQPAKLIKLKSRCVADTRLISMAINNKAREAMAAAGYSGVVIGVVIRPKVQDLVDVTAANVAGLTDVKLQGTAEPKFTITGGGAGQALSVSCPTEASVLIRASGVKGAAGQRIVGETTATISLQGVYR